MSSDYQLEDTLYLPFSTRAFATGIPTALVSGVVDIYEDVTATPIITAETLTVSLNGHAGFNMITVEALAASGFEAGKSYTAILDAGTVDSVSVIGEVVQHWTMAKSTVAKDWINGGRLDLILDIIAADTTTDIPGTITNLQTDLDTLTDARGEPAQGVPGVSVSMAEKIDWLYKFLRNRKTSTDTLINIYNDDTTTVDHKRIISDNGTTYDEEEIITGP